MFVFQKSRNILKWGSRICCRNIIQISFKQVLPPWQWHTLIQIKIIEAIKQARNRFCILLRNIEFCERFSLFTKARKTAKIYQEIIVSSTSFPCPISWVLPRICKSVDHQVQIHHSEAFCSCYFLLIGRGCLSLKRVFSQKCKSNKELKGYSSWDFRELWHDSSLSH